MTTKSPEIIYPPFPASRRTFRSWYDTQENLLIPTEGNHARTVCHWPENFRLSSAELGKKYKQNTDYDDEILYLTMLQGFVRIHIPAKSGRGGIPNLEGTRLNYIQKAAKAFSTLLQPIDRLVLVQRTGPNRNQAMGWVLEGAEEFVEFCQQGTVSKRFFDFYQTQKET